MFAQQVQINGSTPAYDEILLTCPTLQSGGCPHSSTTSTLVAPCMCAVTSLRSKAIAGCSNRWTQTHMSLLNKKGDLTTTNYGRLYNHVLGDVKGSRLSPKKTSHYEPYPIPSKWLKQTHYPYASLNCDSLSWASKRALLCPIQCYQAYPSTPPPPPRCDSYAKVPNQCGPYAYCSLDEGVAGAQHIQLPTHP